MKNILQCHSFKKRHIIEYVFTETGNERREREASADKYSRLAFKGVKSQASRASTSSVLKTREAYGRQATVCRPAGGYRLEGRRRRNEKEEKASEKDPDYSASEICNRRSLLPFAAHYRCRTSARRGYLLRSFRSVKRGSRRGGRERWINGNDESIVEPRLYLSPINPRIKERNGGG